MNISPESERKGDITMVIAGSIEPEEALRVLVREAKSLKESGGLSQKERFNIDIIIEDGEILLRDFCSHNVPNVAHHWRRFTVALLHLPKLAAVAFSEN